MYPTDHAIVAFHSEAWGRRWPEETGTIQQSEIHSTNDDDPGSSLMEDKLIVPSQYHYKFIQWVQRIKFAIGILLDFDDVMIIRSDYQLLRNLVKATTVWAIVVTGQAGIRSYKRWFWVQVEC